MDLDFALVFKESWPMLLEGFKVTIEVSLYSIAIGIVIGLISCIMGLSKIKVLKAISAVYVWIIRGTPMVVQAFIVYFAIPSVFDVQITEFPASVITLSLNAGAYLSEIFRSGIQAVDVGQVEASRSLGVGSTRTMFKVVLPQAFKITLPSIVNQFIITIKDTSILAIISLPELCNKAKQYTATSYKIFEVYALIAVCYLALISALMLLSKFIEKKVSYDRKRRKS